MSYVVPGVSVGAAAAYRQALPSPMKKRSAPFESVFSHPPFSEVVCAAAIVRLSGSAEGRTRSSIENGDDDHAAFDGTSTYWLVPLRETAPSLSPGTRPVVCDGEPTYEPFAKPRASTAVEPESSRRQYDVGESPVIAAAYEDEPALFVAVTTDRSVEPTSALLRTYVLPVAPEIAWQDAPLVLHRCHW